MIRKKRMGKGIAKILSGLLVFGMVAGLVPAVPGGTVHAKAAETHTHCVCGTGNLTVDGHKCNKETWTGINKLSDIKGEGHYYLTQNVQLNQVWVCPTGVKLCLNGYSITRTNCVADSTDGNNAVIKINKGTKFWLTDCKTPDKVGKITHAEGASGEGVYNAGTFYMYNGKISGNDGGVKNSKLFSMYGGTITANTSTKKGGGVYNSGTGEITMFGGQIANNTANQNGGGVYNDDGKIMMYEGQITGNTANQEGGGVYNWLYNFTMSGGTISGNSADNGGGVYNEEGTFEMSGGQIADNKVNRCGGGVGNHTGEFTMSGGTISGNVSDWFGGGVYQNSSTLTLSGIVDITGNKVNDNENNLHLGIGNIVNANGLADGAVIGVTTVAIPKENSPVTIASEAASAAHFRSDNSNYVIGTDKDGKVVLQCKEKLPTVPNPVPNTYTYDGAVHTGIELGENYTVASGINSATNAGTYVVNIKPSDGKTWEDGTVIEKPFSWEITKASQNAPAGLVGVKPTTAGGSDGKITGVNENMEYRKFGDSPYTPCADTEITGLSAGTYEVRYKEDKNHNESPAFEVTVPDADKPAFFLEIINGAGNGMYVEGTVVTITADAPATGKVFDKWVVTLGNAVITDKNSETTTVTTKKERTTIKATYKDSETTPVSNPEPKTYTYDGAEHTGIESGENYIVVSGTNSATDAGTYEVIIQPSAGKTWEDGTAIEKPFSWEIKKASQNAPTGLVGEKPATAGGSDGKITGVNENMEYRKSGDSSYIACTGTEITGLSAGTYEVRYKGDKNHEESPAFVVTVPDADKPVYILEIIDGTGNGTYVEGTVVTITANPAADGKVFDKWVKMYGDAVIADENSATTTVTTKIAPTTIKATYKDSETTPTPNPEPTPNPNPEPTPTPTPTPNPAPEATTPTPNPAPATSTPAASTTTAPASSAAAAPAQVTYDILDGAGSSWAQNTDGSLAIRGSGEISKFREVKVDGVTVDPVNYTVTEGSTIITFKPEYLKSLSAGNHSFELVWTDGTAATNFTVAENADQSAKSPKTGEDFSRTLCTVLLMVSCAGLAGMFAKRKRNHAR